MNEDPSPAPSGPDLAGWLRVGLDDWENDACADDSAEPPDDLLALGRYRLIAKLGEGGFGEVWEAEQLEPLRRTVAIKVVKIGMDTRQVIRRFNQERQTLAIMDHPGIAAIHDGGETAAGRPYFVMEKVDGKPVTEYCDRHALSVRRRVELFAGICLAVHHAHQKGALHRDLKPSNILVAEIDGQPAPKVIDFGIAKILGDDPGAEASLLRTQGGWIMGTPAYMSPEQAVLGGAELDTRADIYSLGVLLYELLTGRTPLFPTGTISLPVDQWSHRIRNVEARRPSVLAASVSPEILADRGAPTWQALARQLRGDLDWILLKALDKDREKRYDSAAAFAEDLRRYLDDIPVTAGRPSTATVVWKFAKRNRSFVTAAAASVMILVAASIFSTFAFVRESQMRAEAEAARQHAQTQEQEARRQTQKAEQTLAYLDELLTRAGKLASEGRNPEALRMALDEVTLEIPRFTGDPELRKTILNQSAIIYRSIGSEDKAIPLIQAELEVSEAENGATSPETLEVLTRYSRALTVEDRHDEAIKQADELVRRWQSQDQADPETAHRTFVARRDRADILRRAGRIHEALAEGAAIFADIPPEKRKTLTGWSGFVRHYVSALRDVGRLQEARAMLDEEIANFPDGPDQYHGLSSLHQADARLKMAMGDITGCARSLQLSIEFEQKARGLKSRNLSALCVELSRPLDLQNLTDAAVEQCQKAIEVAASVDDAPQVLAATRALAENLENACRFAEAASAWRNSAIRHAGLSNPTHLILLDQAHAVRALAQAGRTEEAVVLADEVRTNMTALTQDSDSSWSRRLIQTALAYVTATHSPDALPPGTRLSLSQLSEEDLRQMEQSVVPGLVKILARHRSERGQTEGAHLPDAAAVLAYDRAINDRWMDLDETGELFHAAACLRLQNRPDLAVEVYDLVAALPTERLVVPGRKVMAALHKAASLLIMERSAEAQGIIDQAEEAMHRDTRALPSPVMLELIHALRGQISMVAQNSAEN